MKLKLGMSLAVATLLASGLQADETQDRINAMQSTIEQLQSELSELKEAKTETDDSLEYFDKKISELNRNTNGNHLKFDVDYRFSYHNLNYKMAGDAYQMTEQGPKNLGDKFSNDAILSNRLWIGMGWAATNNLSFTGQLAYYKMFGQRSGIAGYSGTGAGPFEQFDWITNENPYDDKIRVRKAYFFYKDDTLFGADLPWTFSIGRRPSLNGHLANFREDDPSASPMGHTINVEYDGLSAKLSLENYTWSGHYIKFCTGRGMSNANAKFFSIDQMTGQIGMPAANTPFVTNPNDLEDIDLAGFIYVPYDDGQYSINTQYTYAWNLIDAQMTQDQTTGTVSLTGMETVGNHQSFTANFIANGIGDGISDFLDDTIFFASGAMTVTDPRKSGQGMLRDQYADMIKWMEGGMQGAPENSGLESHTGYGAWVGLQIPSLITDGGRWGAEWNYGSQYFRPITYGEDTLIGSKVATRGNAYEVYFTEPLVGNMLTFQVRYTYLDYDYTGSNGFFGSTSGASSSLDDVKKFEKMTGMPVSGNYVDTAQELRAYIRYRF